MSDNKTINNDVATKIAMAKKKAEADAVASEEARKEEAASIVSLDDVIQYLSNEDRRLYALATMYSRAVRQPIWDIFTKMKLGASMGLSPEQSLSSIYMIGGRMGVEYTTYIMQAKKAGYTFQFEVTEDYCVAKLLLETTLVGEVKYTIQDAVTAGLVTDKSMGWNKNRKDMLLSKAVIRVVRRYCPEVMNGSFGFEAIDDDVSRSFTADSIEVMAAPETGNALLDKIITNN